MGHLFSRAFRRLTQCTNQARNHHHQQQQHQNESSNQPQQENASPQVTTTLAESIPVGQSIDSAEYRALERKEAIDEEPPSYASAKENEQELHLQAQEEKEQEEKRDEDIQEEGDGAKQQDVEDAVIKIQALVRGHLTRKALKDANYSNQTLPPNALGQRQFDEESLTKNPPSAVFLPSSPLTLQQTTINNQTISSTNKPHLEPIAEATETPATTTTTKTLADDDEHEERARTPLGKIELPPNNNHLDTPAGTRTLRSPSLAGSEVNASIDLGYEGVAETPASASILISDYNLKPATDKNLASVLHLNETVRQRGEQTMRTDLEAESTTTQENNASPARVIGEFQPTPTSIEFDQPQPTANGGSNSNGDCEEEAAAIRIQSAFRGYRTRKNSPYRTRSPNHSSLLLANDTAATANNINNITTNAATNSITANPELNSSALTVQDHDENDGERGEKDTPREVGRRMSRPRRRDSSPSGNAADQFFYTPDQVAEGRIIQGATSIDEFTTTEDTIREATSVQHQQQQEEAVEQTVGDESAARKASSVEEQLLADVANLSSVEDSTQKGEQQEQIQHVQPADQSQLNTLEEFGLVSAALDSAQTTNTFSASNIPESAIDEVVFTSTGLPKASIGTTKSDLSVDLDTDSSFLGAALSLNETTDISVENALVTETAQEQILEEEQAPLSHPVEDELETELTTESVAIVDDEKQEEEESCVGGIKYTDNNFEDELELQGRELVRELEEQGPIVDEAKEEEEHGDELGQESDEQNECALEEITSTTTNQLESSITSTHPDQEEPCNKEDLEDNRTSESTEQEKMASTVVPPSTSLNEQEQHAIELESDDIERRDPRGHVAEERAKSPLIKTDSESQPDFVTASSHNETSQRTNMEGNEILEQQMNNLAVAEQQLYPPQASSGQSSPAPCSSIDPDSSSNSSNDDSGDENDNENKTNAKQQQQQQQTRQQQTGSRNRRRNNRNKKKNKK